MNGENMGNHNVIVEASKNALAWLGVWAGHMFNDVNLSRAALVASIIYSVVNVWIMLERRKQKNESHH